MDLRLPLVMTLAQMDEDQVTAVIDCRHCVVTEQDEIATLCQVHETDEIFRRLEKSWA